MQITIFGTDVDVDETVLGADAATVREQVDQYERGERTTFDPPATFPEALTGEVMRVMRRIPYGETRTYGAVADELGTAAVAVGQACGRNPVPIVVPCHRVVGADSLGGFSAGGRDALALKRRLLEHEAAVATGRAPSVQTRLDGVDASG